MLGVRIPPALPFSFLQERSITKKPTTAQEEESEGIVAKAKAFSNYLELAKTELRKVTWPTVKETRTTSLVVLAFVVVMAIFLGVVDLGLSKLISFILAA